MAQSGSVLWHDMTIDEPERRASLRRVYRAASRGRVDQADCDWRGGGIELTRLGRVLRGHEAGNGQRGQPAQDSDPQQHRPNGGGGLELDQVVEAELTRTGHADRQGADGQQERELEPALAAEETVSPVDFED